MRRQLATTGRTLALLAILSYPVTRPEPLGAQERGPAVLPHSPAPAPLHHSTKACGKKWLKKARRLTPDQLAWMQRQAHRLFTVTANERRLLTIEVLSGPSIRNCDLEREWSRRETTIRVQYFLADGTTAVKLHHFARDEVFFNKAPKIYPRAGRALLRGVNVDGSESNRWLELELLGGMLDERGRWASASPDGAGPETPRAPTLRLAALQLH